MMRVGLLLLALLGLTLGAAALPLGPWNLALSLLFAAGKAGLIGWYFMELRRGDGRLRLFAAAGIFWLLILATLVLSDYLTRFRPA